MMNTVLEGTPDVGIPHKHIVRLLFLIVVLAAFSTAWAEVKLTKVAEYDIPKLGCGGIAYLGGNNYLVLQDHSDSTQAGNATVFPTTINVNGDTGTLSGITFGASIPLVGNGDSEGIACDPCSGGIWISDEEGPTIKEFVLNAGQTSYVNSRVAPIPEIYPKFGYAKTSLAELVS